ncbi:uncharacterized protein LOC131605377 [Vicia villosa]|uniref:uncharacterized protein LOC131605377 n=1 Tax=Vicia villosa TaxID=3911 RepID=UPI00273AAC5B|nr:uncharacterized protein LOC131605377 [Vicia villosa]
MVSALLIKVKFGNALRRINVHVDENYQININMVSLMDKIRSMFDFTADESFNLTYVAEDGEVKNLVDDDVLHEAMIQPGNFLRIYVHGDGLFPNNFSQWKNTDQPWGKYMSRMCNSAASARISVVVMVKFQNKWRRVNVDLDENNQIIPNMVNLTSKIRSIFKFTVDKNFHLTYFDEDGDMINLVDDDDLRDIMRQKLKFLRIDVHENGLNPIQFYQWINRIYRCCCKIDWNEDTFLISTVVTMLMFFLFIMPILS